MREAPPSRDSSLMPALAVESTLGYDRPPPSPERTRLHLDQHLLLLLCALVVVGVGAQWLASRLKIPALLLLLLTGLFLGPLSELLLGDPILDPDRLLGDLLRPIIALSVALVLFEGGLTLDLAEARKIGRPLWTLILSGLFIGFGSVTLLAHYLGGLDFATSATLGAILVVTGPTVILPMLRSARIAFRPAALLKWEGIVNDPFGAILAFLVFAVATITEKPQNGGVLGLVLWTLLLIVANGMLGLLMARLLDRGMEHGWIPEHLKNPVVLATALLAFALGEVIGHEMGLVTVTVLGMGLANMGSPSLERIRWFKEQISTLLISLLFLLLASRLDLADLGRLELRHLLFVLSVLVIARPLVVLVANLGSGLPWRERVLIGWIAPRGVVAAAVAGAFSVELNEAGFPDGKLLVPLVFAVIFLTVSLHGFTIRPLARRLDLAAKGGKGLLMVGAASWNVALAEALVRAGAFVILADTRYHRVAKARMQGLFVYHGDALSEDVDLELPMEQVTKILAATDEDSYNSLVCVHFVDDFGRDAVYQLLPETTADAAGHLKGRTPWGEEGNYRNIARRFWRDGEFKVTALSEAYDYSRFRQDKPEALPLFYLDENNVEFLAEGKEAPIGSSLLYMT